MQTAAGASLTTTQSRPPWVNYLIEGIAKSVKDLATQLVSARLHPPTTTSPPGGMPQGLQSLQQAQTSLPQFITSIPPFVSQPPAYQFQSTPSSPTYSQPTTLPPQPQLPLPQPAAIDTSVDFQRRSEASKRAAETRRKSQAELYAEINRGRIEETIGSEGGKKYIPIEEELAEGRKARANEQRRERYRKRQEAQGKTVKSRKQKTTTEAAENAGQAEIPSSSPQPTINELWSRAEASVAESLGQEEVETDDRPYQTTVGKPDLMREVSEALGIDTKEDVKRRANARRAETKRAKKEPPHMATGGKGWWSKIFGAGQKEQPSKSAQVPYDLSSWEKNNQLIDSLRSALVRAGYTSKDASNISSDRNVLDVWKMNAPHSSDVEALAKLRKSGVLQYGPYDAPHFMREFEKHKKAQEILRGKSLEELPTTQVELSVPEAPPPSIPGVRLNKKGEIITSRKRKKSPFGTSGDTTDLPDLPSGIFKSGGGRLPRMAGGGKYPVAQPFSPPPYPVVHGQYDDFVSETLGTERAQRAEVPVGRAVAPQLSEYKKKSLGAEADVEFRDPYFDMSNKELLDAYRKNPAVPLPEGSDVSQDFASMWRDISRLMPDAAKMVKRVQEFSPEELEEYKKKGSYPRGAFGPTSRVLKIDPDRVSLETLWHELVHAEQLATGKLHEGPLYEKTQGASTYANLTKHGRLIESEAMQRGLQSSEIIDRLRSEIQNEKKPWWTDAPTRATGGQVAPAAIVGDTPGQSIDSIKSDPHTEVIMGNEVIPHQEAVKHRLFDGKPPRYARGGQLPRYAKGGFNPTASARRQMGREWRKTKTHQKRMQIDPAYADYHRQKQEEAEFENNSREAARQQRQEDREFANRNKELARQSTQEDKNTREEKRRNREIVGGLGELGGGDIGGISKLIGGGSGSPVGLALEAAKLVSDIAHGAVKTVIGGAGGVANWAASADADPSKTISGMGDAAAKAGEALSSVVPGAGILLSALGEAGKALGGFMQEMDKTTQRYGEVNPAIAQQQAMGEIRQVMGDMRRGAEGQGDIVRYMQSQQDLQQKFEDMKMKLLTNILKVITPIMEIIEKLPMDALINTLGTALMPLEMIANSINSLLNMQRDDNMPEVQDPARIMLESRPGGMVIGMEGGVGR